MRVELGEPLQNPNERRKGADVEREREDSHAGKQPEKLDHPNP
jgi:hypothetical protein